MLSFCKILATIEERLRNYTESLNFYDKVIFLFKEHLCDHSNSLVMADLAITLRDRGRLKRNYLNLNIEATEDFKEACQKFEEVFKSIDDPDFQLDDEATIYMNYAICKLELNDYLTSVKFFEKSLHIYTSLLVQDQSWNERIFYIFNYLCYICKVGNKGKQALDFAKRAYILAMTGNLNLKMSDFASSTIEVLQQNINRFTFGMEINGDIDFNIDFSSLMDIDWNLISDIPDISGVLDIFNT